MKELFENLEQKLRAIDAPVLQLFNDPLGDERDLIEFIKLNYGIKAVVPPDLLEVYNWHNGTNYEAVGEMDYRRGCFADEVCLEKLPEIENEIHGKGGYDFIEKMLFPFCASLDGEYLAVPLNGDNCLVYCSASDYEIPPYITKYDSIYCFFETMIESFEQDCFELDDREVLVLNFDKYDTYMEIGERMNPKSDYWRVKREFQESN